MFDANRADLANLYQEESVLTFDGQEIKGKEAILAKLTSLPFQQCQHHIGTINCLPSGGAVFVLVTGNVQLDGNQDTLDFSQNSKIHSKLLLL
ncbi:hypothetical protein NL676_019908 [Syzygium grande]|nr:hypothetical protein NL676_019908 [Syzygium grande]